MQKSLEHSIIDPGLKISPEKLGKKNHDKNTDQRRLFEKKKQEKKPPGAGDNSATTRKLLSRYVGCHGAAVAALHVHGQK